MNNQRWKLKYFEKNKYESHLNIFKGLEIENYIKQSLKKYKLNLQSYKFNISTTRITIFLTICEKTRTQDQKQKWKQLSTKLFKEQKNKKTKENECPLCLNKIKNRDLVRIYQNVLVVKRTFKGGKKKKIHNIQFQLVHNHCYNKEIKKKQSIVKESKSENVRSIIEKLANFQLIRETYFKQKFTIKKSNNKKIPKNFFKNLLKNLKQLTKNKFNIILKTKQINEEFLQENMKLSLLELENNFTIPEMKLLYLILTTQRDNSNLLSIFIAKQLKTTKRHNFFLNLLFQNLTFILNQKHSNIEGIKILLKGRLNNAPRSRNRIIKLGKIPIITQNTNNDYSESISITPNGTIGVKVWIKQKDHALENQNKKTQKEKKSYLIFDFL